MLPARMVQQPNLRPGLQTVLKIAGAVEALQNYWGGSEEVWAPFICCMRRLRMSRCTLDPRLLSFERPSSSLCLSVRHVPCPAGTETRQYKDPRPKLVRLQQDKGSDDAEGSAGKRRAGEEKRAAMKESEEQLQQYQPRIPGTVLLIYRCVPLPWPPSQHALCSAPP
jgi:hypothetical protein